MARQSRNYSYDVLVIGSGIIGAGIAFRLAEAGFRVGVVEKEDSPAMHSTARSAAGVRVQFGREANIRLSWESIQEFRSDEWISETEYRPQGYLFLVPDSASAAHLTGVDLQRSIGAPVEVLSVDDAQRYVSFNTDGISVVTYGPADGIIDPHRTTMAYVRRAREHGAEFHFGQHIVAARYTDVWNLSTPNAKYQAPIVVNAAGAWAGQVALMGGFSFPVTPAKRSIYTTAPMPTGHSYPLTIDVDTGFYFRSEGERIIFGRSNPNEPAGFTEGVDYVWLDDTLEAGLHRFPWLADAQLDRKASWWGYYEMTPDDNPILGFMPGVEGWVNAAGFSGHGVQQAAAVARVLTEEISTGRATSIDIDSLRYERFAEQHNDAERLAI